jgi:arginase
MTWQLTGVPYTSMKEPGGIANAMGALRECGLAEELRSLGVEDAGDLLLEEPSGERGPSGVLNEPALVRLVEATSGRVVDADRAGRRPLLVGGDCPVLLGAVAAVRQVSSAPGLLMLDGHEDAWPPALSQTGEASDSEIAIALGRVADLPAPVSRLLPLLESSAIAFLGPRDREELASAGVESLRDQVAFFADDVETAAALRGGHDPAEAALEAMAADGFLASHRPRRPPDRCARRGRLPPAGRPRLGRARPTRSHRRECRRMPRGERGHLQPRSRSGQSRRAQDRRVPIPADGRAGRSVKRTTGEGQPGRRSDASARLVAVFPACVGTAGRR